MIESAEEFVRLRQSTTFPDYNRASNDSASLEVWKDVIERFPEYKQWVVHNKTVPIEILEMLFNDEDKLVRFFVATKRKLTHELFERLVQDKEEHVRNAIALNAKCPYHVLHRLMKDNSDRIREVAGERLKRIDSEYKKVVGI